MSTTRETTAGQLMLPTQPTGSPRGEAGDAGAAAGESRGAQGPAAGISAGPESPPEPSRTADGRGAGAAPAGGPVEKHEEGEKHEEDEGSTAAVTAAVLPFAGETTTGPVRRTVSPGHGGPGLPADGESRGARKPAAELSTAPATLPDRPRTEIGRAHV